MARDDATIRQIRATDPQQSTWLSANAGSGKTRVLTNRVALLLLEGTKPQNILCLTFTNAAAAEMQNRLFERLGAWSMLDDGALSAALAELTQDGTAKAYDLNVARTLFAQAIEAPGGLRIQTIHSFCGSILRRFPLEAGVSPLFTEMDEKGSERLAAEVVSQMASGADADLVAQVARNVSGQDFSKFAAEIANNRAAFSATVELDNTLERLGVSKQIFEKDIPSWLFSPDVVTLFPQAIEMLESSKGVGDRGAAKMMRAINLESPTEGDVRALYKTMVKGSGEPKIGSMPVTAIQKANHPTIPALNDLMEKCVVAATELKQQDQVRKTLTLQKFAAKFLGRYEAIKSDRAMLDYDDLIHKTEVLLTNSSVCDWVMYRLDGGIDHILVDESQDTSPRQWRIIESLTSEFGQEGDDGRERTIFVVGDKKQSIFSFQGADPKEFDRMGAHFGTQLSDLGGKLHHLSLTHSFRSSPAILRAVDTVFADNAEAGFAASGHIAFHSELPGRVDLWTPVICDEKAPVMDWWDPSEIVQVTDAETVLAEKIAAQIDDMVRNEQIPDEKGKPRPIRYGDFLILVQRRSPLFTKIIRACKSFGFPMAGADRLEIFKEIGVQDLRSLLKFLALPQDSLSLAEVLRSPLCGLDEKDLFQLAYHRKSDDLWVELVRRQRDFPDAFAMLRDLRDNSDFLAPFELLDRALTHWGGRTRMLERLGQEAAEGIDAFLGLTRGYEAVEPTSLTGFLAWIEGDETKIKRQIEAGADKIRVMTTHGAKGLEAPIVIVPETKEKRPSNQHPFKLDANGIAYAHGSRDQKTPFQIEQEDLSKISMQQEQLRLLYVAMTRAERWLIICGASEKTSNENAWYAIVNQAMGELPTREIEEGLRFETGQWPERVNHDPTPASDSAVVLPEWVQTAPPPENTKPKYIKPSDIKGAKSLAGEPLLDDPADAARFGTLVHHLLEHLPTFSGDTDALAVRLAGALGFKADAPEIAMAKSQALAVLALPQAVEVFGPNSLVEVKLTAPMPGEDGARISGQADRIVIGDKRVLVVDFKSNAVIPETPADVPEGIVQQMALYVTALCQIYPDHAIETAIIWTAGPVFMSLPHKMVSVPPPIITSA